MNTIRLWHKDLISVLPRQQLLGQWRECCLIAKNIAEKGTPNHILVNRVMDFPINHFYRYGIYIVEEMTRRGYYCDKQKFKKYFDTDQYQFVRMENVFPEWHNERYLRQCYYNLEEKYDCGGISEHEWIKVREKFVNM